MVTMFTTMLSFAKEVSFFTITKDAKTTSLTLSNVKAGDLLSIIDNNEVVLYKETIQQDGIYKKGFDLSTFPNGSYVFELNKAVEIRTMPFTINNNTVNFDKNAEKTIYKPITRVQDNTVFISRLSLEKKTLSIEIYFNSDNLSYSQSDLIYSEKIKNTENINRVFKLADFNKGTYRIIFNTDGKVFTEEI